MKGQLEADAKTNVHMKVRNEETLVPASCPFFSSPSMSYRLESEERERLIDDRRL